MNSRSLIDNHGRPITYLRLAVTDRCNLRCSYCMPPGGIPFVRHEEILSFEEMARLVGIAVSLGIVKVRFTGGEPFARRDFLKLLAMVRPIADLQELHITSNGVEVREFIPQLKKIGISGINVSLDTLRPETFVRISRRDELPRVLASIEALLAAEIPVKINSVVLPGINDDEIVDLAGLAARWPVTVRFIEQMPFNGEGRKVIDSNGDQSVLHILQKAFPDLTLQAKNSGTANLFRIPGFQGEIGVINAYSRQFCGRCNKIRITPTGILKTCLYDNGRLSLLALLRAGAGDEEIAAAIRRAVGSRARDGFAAEACNIAPKLSMAAIGG
ncbi:MAG: GTP 3',8-cyclase MoaA [Deltaproteobacteria bacterium]